MPLIKQENGFFMIKKNVLDFRQYFVSCVHLAVPYFYMTFLTNISTILTTYIYLFKCTIRSASQDS